MLNTLAIYWMAAISLFVGCKSRVSPSELDAPVPKSLRDTPLQNFLDKISGTFELIDGKFNEKLHPKHLKSSKLLIWNWSEAAARKLVEKRIKKLAEKNLDDEKYLKTIESQRNAWISSKRSILHFNSDTSRVADPEDKEATEALEWNALLSGYGDRNEIGDRLPKQDPGAKFFYELWQHDVKDESIVRLGCAVGGQFCFKFVYKLDSKKDLLSIFCYHFDALPFSMTKSSDIATHLKSDNGLQEIGDSTLVYKLVKHGQDLLDEEEE